MGDVEAVRQAIGAPQVNLVGGSYGTRAALEFQRQFPRAVRRLVIDGVAPPDMVLPAAFSTDNQAALERVFAACETDAATCRATYPTLRQGWQALLAGLPKEVAVAHPVTGEVERLTLTREMLLGLVRAPLYGPALAAGLPQALGEAARGRFEPLVGLASAVQGPRGATLAEGMHFSVVCTEDVPRLGAAGAAGASGAASAARGGSGRGKGGDLAASPAGVDYGSVFEDQYRRFCADWPVGAVPPAFYGVPPAPAAALVLSGGADPVTPPRHGERVAQALGAKARHVVVAEAGHGVMALPCMRDVLFRFIAAADDEAALQLKVDCAAALPRPGVFVPPRASAGSRP
jgi:pimeloyl-ACP methyl ester carboxylesterase